MDLLKIATQIFMQKTGNAAGGLNEDLVSQALSALLGASNGQLDLSDLLSKVSGSGLGALAQSWLGDGANAGFSLEQVLSVLGEGQVSQFAGQLGLDQSTAGNALAQMIPELIDQNSQGGGLLDAVGGVSGLAGMASKFFR